MSLSNDSAVSTGTDNLRSFEQTTTSGLVHVEAISLVDPINVDEVARVKSSEPTGTESGVLVRQVGGVDVAKFGGAATSLGQKTSAASIPVVLPSDQTVVVNTGGLTISDAISETAHDLQAAAFDETSNVSQAYILDTITFQFSTAVTKTVTITRTSDGSVLWQDTNDSKEISLEDIDEAFPANANFRIQITQVGSACSADVKAKVLQGTNPIAGDSNVRIQGDGNPDWGDNSSGNEVGVSSDGEVYTTVTERERNVWVGFKFTSVSATTYYGLIDLSDTTTFPHDQTGRIDISSLHLDADRGTFNGYFSIGVITAIDGTQASIAYFHSLRLDSATTGVYALSDNFAPSQFKLGVSGGSLTKGLTNDTETTASVNTGITLTSPAGTFTPAVGDVVIKINRTSGTLTQMNCVIFYHAEASP